MINYINVVCCGEVIGYFTGDICNVSQAMYTIGYDVTDENDCKKGYENNIAAFYIDSNGKYCFHEELVELDYHPLSTKDLRNLCGMSILEFSKYLKIPYRTIQDWESHRRNPPAYIIELIDYKLRHEGRY